MPKLFQNRKQETAYKKARNNNKKTIGSKSASVQANTMEETGKQNQDDICMYCKGKSSDVQGRQ